MLLTILRKNRAFDKREGPIGTRGTEEWGSVNYRWRNKTKTNGANKDLGVDILNTSNVDARRQKIRHYLMRKTT